MKNLIELSEDWQKAQIEIMLRTVLEALSGLNNEDEDLIDYWNTKIPTWMKLNAELTDENGNLYNYLREWNALNTAIKKGDPDKVMRDRILRKSQMITDIMNHYSVWMKVFSEKPQGKEGAFAKPWKVNDAAAGPAGGPK